jgi:hypothetical protein
VQDASGEGERHSRHDRQPLAAMQDLADDAQEGDIVLTLDDAEQLDVGREPGAEARNGVDEEAGAKVVQKTVGVPGRPPQYDGYRLPHCSQPDQLVRLRERVRTVGWRRRQTFIVSAGFLDRISGSTGWVSRQSPWPCSILFILASCLRFRW